MQTSAPDGRAGRGRQLLAVVLLPFTVTVVIPAVLVGATGTAVGWGLPGPVGAVPVVGGAASILVGLRLMWETISLFGSEGEGTLAPWDPTRRLVVRGPYHRVRNPMIAGVGLVLLGEAAVLGSAPILAELGVFALANGIYMPLVEEPGLIRRFGDEYLEYRREVPRWIPRRTPWTPAGSAQRIRPRDPPQPPGRRRSANR
jgi:protein-S-isoprenylcysteine O-methyltransferase Ste14